MFDDEDLYVNQGADILPIINSEVQTPGRVSLQTLLMLLNISHITDTFVQI